MVGWENRSENVPSDAGSFHIIALDKEGGLWEWGHNWLQPKKIRMDN